VNILHSRWEGDNNPSGVLTRTMLLIIKTWSILNNGIMMVVVMLEGGKIFIGGGIY